MKPMIFFQKVGIVGGTCEGWMQEGEVRLWCVVFTSCESIEECECLRILRG